MADTILRKYGEAATINFELFEVDGIDFRKDDAPGTADIFVMKDEGAEAASTNASTDEGRGYSLVLTATEMQAARIFLLIEDQTATKTWLDKAIRIETYGNASAQHAFDLDTASTAQTGDTFALANGATGFVAIDTVVDAVKAKTDNLTFTTANKVDSRVDNVAGTAQTAGDLAALVQTADTAIDAVDVVVDAIKVITDQITFTTANKVDSRVDNVAGTAQTAGDLAALIQTADTAIDAVKAKTDNLTFTTANKVDSRMDNVAGTVQTAGDLAALISTLDTVADAIKVITDQITFTVANRVDVNTREINGATVIGDGNATPWDGA